MSVVWEGVKFIGKGIKFIFDTVVEGWKNIGSWLSPLLEKVFDIDLSNFDTSGFIDSVTDGVAASLDEAQAMLDDEPLQANIEVAGKQSKKKKARIKPDHVVKDAYISKDGVVTKIADDDNILVRKKMPSNEGGAFNQQAFEQSIEKVLERLMAKKEDVKIEVMDVNIDGKKIGEALVKISRRGA